MSDHALSLSEKPALGERTDAPAPAVTRQRTRKRADAGARVPVPACVVVGDIEGELGADLKKLETIAVRALAAKDWKAAVNARSEVARIRERLAARRAADAAAREPDELLRLRLLSHQAAAAGSWVAAQNLERRATAIQEQRAAAEAEERKRLEAAASEGDLKSRLVLALERLPAKIRTEVLDHFRAGGR